MHFPVLFVQTMKISFSGPFTCFMEAGGEIFFWECWYEKRYETSWGNIQKLVLGRKFITRKYECSNSVFSMAAANISAEVFSYK